MFVIIGLGNPGKKYENTKHNVGFMVIDKIAQTINIEVDKKQNQSLIQSALWHEEKILLVKPQTYMNLSGQAVSEIINYYHDQIDDFLIIHDDLDLPLGQLRFKKGGGTGGHNGLKSIMQYLNSQEFNRLKIGIGHPLESGEKVIEYVLSSFSGQERDLLEESIAHAVHGVSAWMAKGIEQAMSEFNQKREIC